MRLRLVKLDTKYQRHLNDMMEEWYATGEKIIPYAIRRYDYREFDKYLNSLEIQDVSEGLVPDSTFFCLDEERDIFVGAVRTAEVGVYRGQIYTKSKLLLDLQRYH